MHNIENAENEFEKSKIKTIEKFDVMLEITNKCIDIVNASDCLDTSKKTIFTYLIDDVGEELRNGRHRLHNDPTLSKTGLKLLVRNANRCGNWLGIMADQLVMIENEHPFN